MEIDKIYQEWADAFASIGHSHISHETAAKILAVIYVYGGSYEGFTHCPALKTDAEAAMRMFNIAGSERPTIQGVELIQKYVRELEEDLAHAEVGEDGCGIYNKACHVEWANRIFKERYGFKALHI